MAEIKGEKIHRGQIVSVGFPQKCLGIIEYLKMNDGSILNSYDNVVTGNGDKNTKIFAIIRQLYIFERYQSWNDNDIPKEYEGEDLIKVDPHNFSVLTKEDVSEFEEKWIKKISFLQTLLKTKPKIQEIKIREYGKNIINR